VVIDDKLRTRSCKWCKRSTSQCEVKFITESCLGVNLRAMSFYSFIAFSQSSRHDESDVETTGGM